MAVSRFRRRLLYTVSGAAILAGSMLAGQPEGLAISFEDTVFRIATGYYGSVVVKSYDGTQRYIGPPAKLLDYSSPSVKLCRGPDGNLRYGAHNLILESEAIGLSGWITTNLIVTDGHLDPIGGMTAQLLVKNTSTGNHRTLRAAVSQFIGARMFAKIRIKYAGHRYIGLEAPQGSGATVIDTLNGEYVSGTLVPEITALGNGWWEYSFVGTKGSGQGTIYVILLGSGDNNGTENEAGDGVSGIYVWRAHAGFAPADPTYLKTTDSAVYELPFEWDVDGNLLGIRVEEQRTNLFLNNRSPATQNITVTAVPHTLSFYGTGSITLSGAHSDTLEGTGENERVTLTFTPEAGTLTCTVDGDIDFVQLEAGSFATSPIETAGSTVTRAADNISLATSAFPEAGVGSTPVSILAEFITADKNAPGNEFIYALSTGGNNPRISAFKASGTKVISHRVTSGGVSYVSASGGTIADNINKLAVAVATDDYVAYLNGAQVLTDDSVTLPPSLTRLSLGADEMGTAGFLNSHLRSLVVVPRRMPNTELQTLTGA